MDVVGSEIGQKMRSAIKAKLTELGCYVDDELPDYVMVMVANKRTRAQMEDDLQLFLGDNTELFVNWLHQVLKKLQEVTVTAPIKPIEPEKSKEKEKTKEKKAKEKKEKDKSKKSDIKKAKKKEKEKIKSQRKKEEKKAHKKKKSKHDEMIRPNIPPLLTNIEKVSEPSITDVFAGQILKNHGIIIDTPKEILKESKPEIKVPEMLLIETVKRPIVPIIDPATILSEPTEISLSISDENSQETIKSNSAPRENQLKEINEIEAKIQGLKQKLAEQLDSMSDDEDFLNIRTEAEELMNDFAEDVFQEITQQATDTPPIPAAPPKSPLLPRSPKRSRSPIPSRSPIRSRSKSPAPVARSPINFPAPKEPEVLPQIELKLPKRPVRERLGIREEPKRTPVVNDREKAREDLKKSESPERFTPEREPPKSAKSRLGDPPEPQRKRSITDEVKHEPVSKRLTSKVSVLENRTPRVSCASVVRVRPRPRVPAPASSLLLRAVADAHKSLLNAPKMDPEPTIKRAFVRPMRRCDPQKILIQVPGNEIAADDADAQDAISLGDPESEDSNSKMDSDIEKDEYVPTSITKKFLNTDYTPSLPKRSTDRTSTRKDDSFVIEAINIHNPTVDKDKNTKFIVTMDGYHPNAFLAKKLKTEGLLNDGEEPETNPVETEPKITEEAIQNELTKEVAIVKEVEESINSIANDIKNLNDSPEKKRVSDTSEESDTQVIIEKPIPKIVEIEEKIVKRNSSETNQEVQAKRRKSSPIVFDVKKIEDAPKVEDRERQRTESAGSDNHVTVTTTTSTHKYDSLPPLSTAERKPIWCRAFPQCRYGASCAFQHPRCRFAAACTRRSCPYAHTGPAAAPLSPLPVVASHVVPAANYKSISATALPAMCKYYPSCSNAACHFYHPKPCRYGKSCANKFDCNFYHADVPASKWRCTV